MTNSILSALNTTPPRLNHALVVADLLAAALRKLIQQTETTDDPQT
jgi:hypothetical protein